MFSQNGLDLKFHQPVDTDSQGRVIGVRGFGDAARQMANKSRRTTQRRASPSNLGQRQARGNLN
jgi:hypothetical protein